MDRRRIEAAGILLSLLAIAVVTLLPGAPSKEHVITLCLACATNGGASALLNVALFMPLGFFLYRRLGRTWQAFVIGAGISFTIELLQLFVVPGRETALGDLIANSAGATAGAALAWRPSAWLFPRGRVARLAAAIAAGFVTLTLFATSRLLQPSAPAGGYWVQWNPEAPMGALPGGEVVGADLDGGALTMGKIVDPDWFRARILGGSTLHVRLVVHEPAADPEPLFRVVTGAFNQGTIAFSLAAHRDALLVEPRFVADDRDLARPWFRLDGALAGTRVGDTIDVRVHRVPGEGEAVAVGEREPVLLSNRVGRGWSLIYTAPNHVFALRDFVDLAWLGALALLVAWLAQEPAVAAVLALPVLLMAWWAPRGSDLAPTQLRDYLALIAGTAAGVLLRFAIDGWRVRRRRRAGPPDAAAAVVLIQR